MTEPESSDAAHVSVPAALLFDERLSDGAKVLWALLFQFSVTSGDGGHFEMTGDQMATLTRSSKPSVIKRKRELVEAGWLAEVSLRGFGKANLLEITYPVEGTGVTSEPAQPQ